MSYRVLGIDPSTKMGLVLLKKTGSHIVTLEAEEYSSKQKGMERLDDIGQKIVDVMGSWEPDVVWLEGYSFMSKHNLVTMAEVGTVIRMFLWQADYEINEIAPPRLKKFTCGKGNAKKDVMLLQVFKNWGFTTHNDNVADAYAIAMYGMYKHLGAINSKGEWKKVDTEHFKYDQLAL